MSFRLFTAATRFSPFAGRWPGTASGPQSMGTRPSQVILTSQCSLTSGVRFIKDGLLVFCGQRFLRLDSSARIGTAKMNREPSIDSLRSAVVRCAKAVRNRARGAYLLHVARDEHAVAFAAWKNRQGDQTLRVCYPLGTGSIVFDVGGYRGDWAAAIDERYKCRIHIFEPIAEYARQIQDRFRGCPNIAVHQYGLGSDDAVVVFDKSGDQSRESRLGQPATVPEQTKIRNIGTVLPELGISRISLMKINIEGGEYSLLDHMLNEDLVRRCQDIQIQFHNFVPNARSSRSAIRRRLAASHDLTYDFPFVWENWRSKAQVE